jgi:hypothetical protein
MQKRDNHPEIRTYGRRCLSSFAPTVCTTTRRLARQKGRKDETNPRRAVLSVSLLLCFATAVFAQRTSGDLEGKVLDQTDAVVPNVSITLTGVTVSTAELLERSCLSLRDKVPIVSTAILAPHLNLAGCNHHPDLRRNGLLRVVPARPRSRGKSRLCLCHCAEERRLLECLPEWDTGWANRQKTGVVFSQLFAADLYHYSHFEFH